VTARRRTGGGRGGRCPLRRCGDEAACGKACKGCEAEEGQWLPAAEILGHGGNLAEIAVLEVTRQSLDAGAQVAGIAAHRALLALEFGTHLFERGAETVELVGDEI